MVCLWWGLVCGFIFLREDDSRGECLLSFDNYAFDVEMKHEHGEKTVAPSEPWEKVFTIENNGQALAEVIGIRNYNGKDEVWIYNGSRIIIYYPEIGEWEIINIKNEKTGVYNYNIIINNNEVYGINVWSPKSIKIETVSALSIFNEETKEFDLLENSLNLPIKDRVHNFGKLNATVIFDLIIADEDGNFWILHQYHALYKFSPSTDSIEKIVDLPHDVFFREMIYSLNDEIILQKQTGKYKIVSGDILIVDPSTRSIKAMLIKEEIPNNPIFLSKEGNLWIGPFVWFDEDGVVHQLVDEPVETFVSRYSHMEWTFPQIYLESSDEVLWFLTTTDDARCGTGWYDPIQGDGCQISTYCSNIVEDDNATLWQMSADSLYRLELEVER